MPELHMRIAYSIVLLLMVCIAIGMLVYFRRLGWLQRTRKPVDEAHR
jgi:Mg2+ and Co2+ transporter CorA